jgi:hypothetical protein
MKSLLLKDAVIRRYETYILAKGKHVSQSCMDIKILSL